jgi:hypothetical protein
MSGRRELAGGAKPGDRIDADMRYKTPVLGGDQHPAVERVDLIWLDRQPPFAVPGQEAPQDRPVAREHEDRGAAAAVERRRWEHEISGRGGNRGQKNGDRGNYPDAG